MINIRQEKTNGHSNNNSSSHNCRFIRNSKAKVRSNYNNNNSNHFYQSKMNYNNKYLNKFQKLLLQLMRTIPTR